MIMGKHTRKAVALAGVLAAALVGATAVGLWGGPVSPASTDAALVHPAAAMDLDGGVCMGDSSEDFASVALPEGGVFFSCRPPLSCPPNPPGCQLMNCEPCCWNCGGNVYCQD